MKGLILKDFFVMSKTIKTYIFVIILYIAAFGIMDGNTTAAILVSTIVISMAPVTAIAYDEQSKWDKMAGTMPVSTKTIVLSKYIFSLMLSVSAAFFSTVLVHFFDKTNNIINLFAIMVMAIMMAAFYHSLLFPTVYKFGTTKGRIYTMLIMFLPAIITGVLSFLGFWTSAVIIMLTEHGNLVVIGAITSTVLLYIGSILLSVRIYKNKEW